jgi:hypothetical protein
MLIAPLSALLLSAGCRDTADAVQPPPAALVDPCPRPQALPPAGLTQAQAEVLWGRDRAALAGCGDRHAALAAYLRGVSGGR